MPENIITPAVPASRNQARATQELQKIADSSQEVLAGATTVFPLDLFPDSITVDRTQVTITARSFFWMGGVTSIRIEDILNVTAHVGPFFGSVRIATRYFDNEQPFELRRLWRKDALRLQAIIHGLIIAAKKEIDAAQVEASKLAYEAEKLGQPSGNDLP